MSTVTDNKEELRGFLKTLKVHNKDIDGCFNDALAVHKLLALIEQREQLAITNYLKVVDGKELTSIIKALSQPKENKEKA